MIGLGFAAPWVLAAAAALAIPILAHLARHEDRAGQGFPSLMFLRRVPFPARARHRLEDRVLLALRALALLALVLAFAGPYPRFASGAAAPSSDTVVLLDLSYSMGLGDRFTRARAAADAALAEGGADARVALVGFDSAPRTLSALADGRAAAQAALARAAPGVRGTDLARALEGAWRLLADSSAPRRRVVLVSDLQAAGLGADARLPDAVELQVRAVSGAMPANLAILAAWRDTDAPDGDGRTLLRVRVANTGGEAGAATLRMAVDGLAAAEQALELAPGERRDLALTMFPAADRATRVHLHLDPAGALPADDARFLVLTPPRTLDVLMLRDEARGDDYVEAALALSRDPILRGETLTAQQVTAQRVARADAVVLDGTPVLADAVLRALDARVAQGAGLLVFAGAGDSPTASLPAGLPAPAAIMEAGAQGTRIGALAHNHPLARSLGSARVDGIRVWRHRAPEPGPDDAVLARYADGSAALIERVHGNGRALLFTTSPARGWSDLAVDPVFVPLLLESLGYLTGTVATPAHYAPGSVLDVAAHVAAVARDGPLARALAAGEAIWLRPPAGEAIWLRPPAGDAIYLRPPAGEAIYLRPPAGDARRVRALDPLYLDAPGFHELRADGGALLPLAVNVVTAESSLHALEAQDFSARVRRYPQPAPPRVAADHADSGDDTLARALLLLAICLLLAEGAFAARVTRLRPAAEAGA